MVRAEPSIAVKAGAPSWLYTSSIRYLESVGVGLMGAQRAEAGRRKEWAGMVSGR